MPRSVDCFLLCLLLRSSVKSASTDGPPKVGEFSFPSKLAIGDEVIALCVVKKGSAGPYRITWHRDGAELMPSERLSMSALFRSSAALSIASLRPEDVGNYTCTAMNAAGSDSASAMLVVHGQVFARVRGRTTLERTYNVKLTRSTIKWNYVLIVTVLCLRLLPRVF